MILYHDLKSRDSRFARVNLTKQQGDVSVNDFLKDYTEKWLAATDGRLDDIELRRAREEVEKLQDEIKESTANVAVVCPLLIQLDDEYTYRETIWRDIYFQRGMTYAFMLITGMVEDDKGLLNYMKSLHKSA